MGFRNLIICCLSSVLPLLVFAGCSTEAPSEPPGRVEADAMLRQESERGGDSEGGQDTGANRPPFIRSVRLVPSTLVPGMDLRAEVESADPDADPLSLEYKWQKNGEILLGEWSATLATGEFLKGDSITVAVTPSDGKSQGETAVSDPATIRNRPPELRSTPPGGLENGKFVYQVQAVDPDGDVLSFALEKSPPGMTIDVVTGRVEWTVTADEEAVFPVKITAADGEETIFQEFTITVSAP